MVIVKGYRGVWMVADGVDVAGVFVTGVIGVVEVTAVLGFADEVDRLGIAVCRGW